MTQVKLYDTTLRDGMQGQGMSLSAAEKVRVVQALDRLGFGFIEAGFPSSNPKEAELFGLLADVKLEQAQICAFGMTRRRDMPAAEDEALRGLVGCAAPVVTFVGKTWGLHLEKVTKVSREENLSMIVDSVNLARAEGKRVILDAEHFFEDCLVDTG
jgi:2-isopropylmalate synthase